MAFKNGYRSVLAATEKKTRGQFVTLCVPLWGKIVGLGDGNMAQMNNFCRSGFSCGGVGFVAGGVISRGAM